MLANPQDRKRSCCCACAQWSSGSTLSEHSGGGRDANSLSHRLHVHFHHSYRILGRKKAICLTGTSFQLRHRPCLSFQNGTSTTRHLPPRPQMVVPIAFSDIQILIQPGLVVARAASQPSSLAVKDFSCFYKHSPSTHPCSCFFIIYSSHRFILPLHFTSRLSLFTPVTRSRLSLAQTSVKSFIDSREQGSILVSA